MARNSASEGMINHYNAVRMRLVGSGNLLLTMNSYDSVDASALVPIPMSATTAREALRLANFNSTRMSLDIRTVNIDEKFRINKIVIFAKPVATQFPG